MKKFLACFLLAATALVIVPFPVSAEVNSAEELFFMEIPNVVTASKKAESIDTAPNVMYVVTKEDIQKRGYRSIKDIFQVIPGFGVAQRDIQVVGQVRGIAPNDNEKIAMMVNGHVINQVTEPEYFQAGAFPLDQMERIEIIVGPGGVFYGGETLCAIINLITKKMDGSQVVLSGGSPKASAGTLMIGKGTPEDNIFISASEYQNSGYNAWQYNAASTEGRSLSTMHDITGRVFPSYALFGTANKGNLELNFFSQNSQEPDLHLVGGGAATDARRFDNINSLGLRDKAKIADRLTAGFELYADAKRTSRMIQKVGSGDSSGDNYDLSQNSYKSEASLQYKDDHNYLQGGIQVSLDQNRQNYDFVWNPDSPYAEWMIGTTTAPWIRPIVQPSQTYARGVYLSEEFKPVESLTLTGAVRADRNDILQTTHVYYSPRAALVWNPVHMWTGKVMFNTATRLSETPQGTPWNKIWGSQQPLAPSWGRANPNILRPEILRTTELQNIFYLGKTRTSVNVYHQELKDFATWYGPRTNVGDFVGNGLEVDAKYKPVEKVNVWGNLTYLRNKFKPVPRASIDSVTGTESVANSQVPANDKGEAMGVPRVMANLGLDWQVLEKVSFSPVIRYFTLQPMKTYNAWHDVKDAHGNIIDQVGYWGYANDRVYVDATIVYQGLLKNMDVSLIGKNIFNNRQLVGTQWLADAIHPEGTTVEGKVSYKF